MVTPSDLCDVHQRRIRGFRATGETRRQARTGRFLLGKFPSKFRGSKSWWESFPTFPSGGYAHDLHELKDPFYVLQQPASTPRFHDFFSRFKDDDPGPWVTSATFEREM